MQIYGECLNNSKLSNMLAVINIIEYVAFRSIYLYSCKPNCPYNNVMKEKPNAQEHCGFFPVDVLLHIPCNMGHYWYMLTRTKITVVYNKFKVKA